MKNQPSPSLISLSPLITSHPRALRRSWVRSSGLTPFNLLAIRSLGFGCDPHANLREDRLAGPLYKRYAVAYNGALRIIHLIILTRLTPPVRLVLFQPSFTVLVYYHSPCNLRLGGRPPYSVRTSHLLKHTTRGANYRQVLTIS